MDKMSFLNAFRLELEKLPGVRQSPFHIELFMEAAEKTLKGEGVLALDSRPMTGAWEAIGGVGEPTEKQLLALPQ